jgi:hypothetical protein
MLRMSAMVVGTAYSRSLWHASSVSADQIALHLSKTLGVREQIKIDLADHADDIAREFRLAEVGISQKVRGTIEGAWRSGWDHDRTRT